MLLSNTTHLQSKNHLHTRSVFSQSSETCMNIEHSTENKLDAYHTGKKTREIPIAGKWWMGVQNESSDKYTCIDCNVSYFFGVSYKFTSCTIFTRELVAAWLVAEMEKPQWAWNMGFWSNTISKIFSSIFGESFFRKYSKSRIKRYSSRDLNTPKKCGRSN